MDTTLILKTYNLQTHPHISVLEYENEEDWLRLRKKGIGGSDVGAIMGMNPYTSPLQVYKDKTEESTSKTDTVYTRKGKDLEALIRNYYVVPELAKEGYKVIPVKHILINEAYPWLRANLDGIAIPEEGTYEDNIVIEIKWVSEWGAAAWDNDDYRGVPPSYYAQVQTYLAVTGAKTAIICALFDSSWKVKYYKITRDEVFIMKLISQTKQFMELNVEMKIPPRVNTSLDRDYISEEVSKIDEVSTIEDEAMNEDITRFKAINAQIKNLEKESEALKDIIVNKYLEGHRPTLPTCKVKISSYVTRRFDNESFKQMYPTLYANYLKETSTVRINIK